MRPFSWYVLRLRAMSPREMLARFGLSLRKKRWRRLVGRADFALPRILPDAKPNPPWPVAFKLTQAEQTDILAEAKDVVAHRWSFFDADGCTEEQIDWHRDPKSGIAAPRKFSFDIDYRDEKLVGNIKNTWEKSRHHHLTLLALAHAASNDDRYLHEIRAQLTGWIEQNPYLVGVNWNQGLEAGIRLIAWLWTERLLGKAGPPLFFDPRIRPMIYQHQLMISQTRSQGSSANNHLVGEMAGLFVAAATWQWFPESRQWQETARAALEREIITQTFDSGIHREQGFSYQLFVIEFFLLAAFEARRIGRPFSDSFHGRLRKMIEAIPALTDVGGNLPRYGDGDEGMAVQLQPAAWERAGWLYEVGAALVGAESPLPESPTLPARILGQRVSARPFKPARDSQAFSDAGLFVLSNARGTDEEIFVLADAGPLGYLSIAAHGHADALSFTLSVGGRPILVDPGTYCYHTDLTSRRYFRGTSAHNTVTVDGRDQSTQGGPFLWTRRANVAVTSWAATADGALLEAGHDGYAGIGVRHRRRIALAGRRLTLTDAFAGGGTHRLEAFFHCDPACACRALPDGSVEIHRPGTRVVLTPWPGATLTVHAGGSEHGWFSPRFGVKVPAPTVVLSCERPLPAELISTVDIQHER